MEKVFKDIYEQNPDQNLDMPHDMEYVQDLLNYASAKSSHLFPAILTNTLEDDLFFQGDLDTEIYQHLRYLPCNRHTHSFLEVVCVIQGSCPNYIKNQYVRNRFFRYTFGK